MGGCSPNGEQLVYNPLWYAAVGCAGLIFFAVVAVGVVASHLAFWRR